MPLPADGLPGRRGLGVAESGHKALRVVEPVLAELPGRRFLQENPVWGRGLPEGMVELLHYCRKASLEHRVEFHL